MAILYLEVDQLLSWSINRADFWHFGTNACGQDRLIKKYINKQARLMSASVCKLLLILILSVKIIVCSLDYL